MTVERASNIFFAKRHHLQSGGQVTPDLFSNVANPVIPAIQKDLL
jgi:hypothetical protein